MKVIPQNFQKVIDYLKQEKDVDVKLGGTTVFLGMGLKRIFVDYRYDLSKNGLYALLHEAGHALQPEKNEGVNIYKSIDEERYPTKHKMLQFLNEVDAWERGLRLAKTLNIPIDTKSFNKLKNDALMTYFK